MTEEGTRVSGRIRPTIMTGGDGNTAFIDVHDLHPVNETSATVSGVAGGAIVGGLLGAVPSMLAEESKKLTFRNGGLIAMFTVIGAAIGGVVAQLNARTHNKWSDRLTAATVDKTQKLPERSA